MIAADRDMYQYTRVSYSDAAPSFRFIETSPSEKKDKIKGNVSVMHKAYMADKISNPSPAIKKTRAVFRVGLN